MGSNLTTNVVSLMGRVPALNEAFTRSLSFLQSRLFTGYKHDHYKDFGFPEVVDFDFLYELYQRNSLAKAAVDKTTRKTWQDPPWLLETPRDGSEGATKKETRIEKAIRHKFTDLRFWTKVMEADRRSLVGRFSGIILRVADGRPTDQPLGTVTNGIDGLVDIIPCWESQLKVKEWNNDVLSVDYGEPTMYEYDEGTIGPMVSSPSPSGTTRRRRLTVHPSRVIIWSFDGSLDCDSALKAGVNDLLSLEKIVGAGGEGFWKNAKQAPILEMDKEADMVKMAKAMGVDPTKLADVMNEQAAAWQKGFDELLMLQGMTAKLPKIELPDPEHFFMNALMSFSASFDIPLKVLVGTQTGERASTEDASQWNQTCNFRRKNTVIPNLMQIVKRLETCGVLKENPEWFIDWTDLTEATILEKIDRVAKMAKVNKDAADIVFMPREMRATVGYEPADESEISRLREARLPPPKEGATDPKEDDEDDVAPEPKVD